MPRVLKSMDDCRLIKTKDCQRRGRVRRESGKGGIESIVKGVSWGDGERQN